MNDKKIMTPNIRWGLFVIAFLFFHFLNAQNQRINQRDAQGKRQGPWKKTYKNSDQIRYEGTFNHGKETGTFKFYQRGSKKFPTATKTYHVQNDSVLEKFFTRKGKIISKGNVIDRKREGRWKYYHKDGKLMMIEHYKNGELNGKKSIFYSDGSLTQEENYKNGVLHGEFKIFSKNGTLTQQYHYLRGKLEGPAKTYNEEGQLSSEGNYKAGERDGVWKFYKNGKIKEKKTYPLAQKALQGNAKKTD